MKHLRTLLAVAFASALASTAVFAEGEKKPEAKSEKAACCVASEKGEKKACCVEKKACCGDAAKKDEKPAEKTEK